MKDTPNTDPSTAPSAAPADTPINPGSANGFLNKPCKVAPAIPKDAPTNIAKITLGNRILNIISYSVWVKSSIKNFKNETEKPPYKKPSNELNTKNKNNNNKINLCL